MAPGCRSHPSHIEASKLSFCLWNVQGVGTDLDLIGPIAFSGQFITCDTNSVVQIVNLGFTGAATNKRFDVKKDGIIDTNGSDPLTYLPGDAFGTAENATGGYYV